MGMVGPTDRNFQPRGRDSEGGLPSGARVSVACMGNDYALEMPEHHTRGLFCERSAADLVYVDAALTRRARGMPRRSDGWGQASEGEVALCDWLAKGSDDREPRERVGAGGDQNSRRGSARRSGVRRGLGVLSPD
ncbi:hypothetical protein U9M48_003679 [Paspalum notatum var. saurae]|uniref:Uncharacterized protein n=1 Tax=Paspalum notatum var. saurae TaxID=547442 RepID=A0AAQ3PTZ2_PASNO